MSAPPPPPPEDATPGERIAKVEATQDAMLEEFHDFRTEVRRRLDGIDQRLLTFAFTVAGSALGVALTVYFTR